MGHSCGILHRDLNPENFLLEEDGISLCICDFGSAGRLEGPGPHPAIHAYITGTVTTAAFNAPEVLRDRKHYASSDIWAIGFAFYDCLSLGTLPNDEVLESFKNLDSASLNAAVRGIISSAQLDREVADSRP